MKRIIFATISLLLAISGFSQDINGSWSGVLDAMGNKLPLVINISENDGNYSATMDSPTQGAKGIPIGTVNFENEKLTFAIPNMAIEYEGIMQADSIAGTFKQGSMAFPLNLKKTDEVFTPVRPQEPKPPYPYISEDVTFENKLAEVTLAGTLTMPSSGNNFTAVILISGSGSQDRNEEIMGHKPFLVVADYLTRHGIAVLRYDDRGFAQSTGDFMSATTADFATDTESAVEYLKSRKEINPNKIGLMGHSEGGIIAPMIAARSKDIGFIVMLAGTGLRGYEIILTQVEELYKVAGVPANQISETLRINKAIYDLIIESKEDVSKQEITDLLTSMEDDITQIIPAGISFDNYIQQLAAQMSSPWMQYFLRYDPAPALELVKCPVLAVNGSKDLQVISKENLSFIGKSLEKGGNKRITIKEYPGLNHLFQECTTGLPNEYAIIEQTFSPEVLQDLTDWILNL